jgi:hypothetical protein
MKKKYFKNQKGFIALMTFLILSAISLAIGIGLSFRSISESKMSLQKNQSSLTYYLANLCAEHSLMQLKGNIGYNGNESISITEGSCQILPIEGNWTLKIIASSSQQVKKMKIVVSQAYPKIIISSWNEVAEF